jgi:hypothetical protein
MRKYVLLSVLLFVGFISGMMYRFNTLPAVKQISEEVIQPVDTLLYNAYSGTFKDFNSKHILSGICWKTKKGLELPVRSLDALDGIEDLVAFSHDSVVIDPMTHSRPVLIAEAKELLVELGSRFQAELRSRDLPLHSVIVTSMTRSKESQAQLERVNTNAASNSAHLFGTTFDITYKRYRQNEFVEQGLRSIELKKALEHVISEMREEKKIWVVEERAQPCFHITLRCIGK